MNFRRFLDIFFVLLCQPFSVCVYARWGGLNQNFDQILVYIFWSISDQAFRTLCITTIALYLFFLFITMRGYFFYSNCVDSIARNPYDLACHRSCIIDSLSIFHSLFRSLSRPSAYSSTLFFSLSLSLALAHSLPSSITLSLPTTSKWFDFVVQWNDVFILRVCLNIYKYEINKYYMRVFMCVFLCPIYVIFLTYSPLNFIVQIIKCIYWIWSTDLESVYRWSSLNTALSIARFQRIWLLKFIKSIKFVLH